MSVAERDTFTCSCRTGVEGKHVAAVLYGIGRGWTINRLCLRCGRWPPDLIAGRQGASRMGKDRSWDGPRPRGPARCSGSRGQRRAEPRATPVRSAQETPAAHPGKSIKGDRAGQTTRKKARASQPLKPSSVRGQPFGRGIERNRASRARRPVHRGTACADRRCRES